MLPAFNEEVGGRMYLDCFKCPICSKSVASDEMEMHFIMCLSKPRLSYNGKSLAGAGGNTKQPQSGLTRQAWALGVMRENFAGQLWRAERSWGHSVRRTHMPGLDSGGGEGMGFSPGELPGIPAAPLP
ncbi:hypothetical protein DBR06_SOUSAS110395, partial [Sousa chinensis]